MNRVVLERNCGGLHPKVGCEMIKYYEQLFEKVREMYPRRRLSRFFPLEGYRYNEFEQIQSLENLTVSVPAVRLMVVCRSVNGWTEILENSAKEFSDSMTDTLIPGGEGFMWLDDGGIAKETYINENGEKKRYNVNRSAFFRCARAVIGKLKPITLIDTRWFEHIVWTNLYPIAPLYGGNAEGRLRDIQLELSRKILLEQIKHYRPTHILFITDWEYWFECFAPDFPNVVKRDNGTVVGKGMFNGIRVVVSSRPDRTRPSKPDERLFAEKVVEGFLEI